jgi:hypothetical protein
LNKPLLTGAARAVLLVMRAADKNKRMCTLVRWMCWLQPWDRTN